MGESLVPGSKQLVSLMLQKSHVTKENKKMGLLQNPKHLCFKGHHQESGRGAGEMYQALKAMGVISEDPQLVPSTLIKC